MAEGRAGHALVYVGGEAVEPGSAAAAGVFAGIEQADPQASGSGVAGFVSGPRPAGGGQAGDRRPGLGDDAVRRR
jgi:hypothetical protein